MFQLSKHIANELGALTKVCLLLLLLIGGISLADRTNPKTLKRHGLVTSTLQTSISLDLSPKEYVWVVNTSEGQEVVHCSSEETFRQKSIGDTVTFTTNYGWLSGKTLKNFKH